MSLFCQKLKENSKLISVLIFFPALKIQFQYFCRKVWLQVNSGFYKEQNIHLKYSIINLQMEFIKTENFAETFQTGSEGLAET